MSAWHGLGGAYRIQSVEGGKNWAEPKGPSELTQSPQAGRGGAMQGEAEAEGAGLVEAEGVGEGP